MGGAGRAGYRGTREGDMRDPSVALPGGTDPARRTRELRRAHAAFTLEGRVEAPVRTIIAKSWRRCARARVSPECAPRVELAGAELRPYREQHPLAGVMPLFRDLVGAFAVHGAHLLAVCDARVENLGRARTLRLDKTGTLTRGRPASSTSRRPRHHPHRSPASGGLGRPVLAARPGAGHRRHRPATRPFALPPDGRHRGARTGRHRQRERPPRLHRPPGSRRRTRPWARAVDNRALRDGAAVAWLSVDGQLAGAILLRDPLRHDAPRPLRHLRAAGIQRLLMLTGDRAAPAHEVAALLGLDGVLAELSPAGKVTAVRDERGHAVTVMVGDGVNDAPALTPPTSPWAPAVPRPPQKRPTSS
ncbi:HAD-IC family P-type ATPase [Streptomyces sp. NPDC002587]